MACCPTPSMTRRTATSTTPPSFGGETSKLPSPPEGTAPNWHIACARSCSGNSARSTRAGSKNSAERGKNCPPVPFPLPSASDVCAVCPPAAPISTSCAEPSQERRSRRFRTEYFSLVGDKAQQLTGSTPSRLDSLPKGCGQQIPSGRGYAKRNRTAAPRHN